MDADLNPAEAQDRDLNIQYRGGSSDAVYALGLIGAWVYYIGRAHTFREGLLGFFKGLFWPAFLVYDALKYLNRE
jgi:hypothetical protein